MDTIAAAEPRSTTTDEFLPASTWTRAYTAHTGRPCPLNTRKLVELARDGAFPAEQRGAKREWGLEQRHLPRLVEVVSRRAVALPVISHAA